MEDGCQTSFLNAKVPDFTKIGPLLKAMVRNTRIWDLRELKDVIIPDGAEKIGS